ncbi:hypothetical protein BaRGS_00032915 [Batillaria attramentaria]|uniref:Uncharacterized protein n=1 Tax=Batillaria attramentaria TaxID=370345 RepID=A0ABD0JLM0_9CAEN
MEETLENHKKNNEALELSNEKLAAERDAFELREEAAQKQNLKLKQRTEQLESRVAVLERQLENAEQSKQLLESVLEENENGAAGHSVQAPARPGETGGAGQQAGRGKVQLEEERDQLKETLAKLEAEKEKLLADVMNRMKKAETLEKEVLSLRGVVEEKAALQEKLDKCLKEAVTLKSQMKALQQQVEADSTKMTQLEEERDHMLSEKVRLSVHLKQQEEDTRRELTEEREQLRQALEEVQQRASLAEKESCTLREKALQQSVQIEELKKDLETARAQVSSSVSSQPAPGETVPMIDFKKMELMQKLEAYEDPESPANKEKEIENLTNSLKRKDLELSYIQSQHKKELEALTKQLSNAQEMITYKESSIAKLKGEIRRIRSEEVSFCAPPAPKPQPAAQAAPTQSSSGQAAEERVISSHSGIIDRYTVTLLEADKYKLQKELRKTQDRLKKTEAELHLTKVALSKATGGGEMPTQPLSSVSEDSTKSCEKRSSAMRQVSPRSRADSGETRLSMDSVPRGSQRPQLSPLGSPVDGVVPSQSNGQSGVESLGDSSLQLPSASDKENLPLTPEALTSPPHSASKPGSIPDAGAEAESPLNIEPEFWKKPVMPPRLRAPYRSLSSRPLGLKPAAGECKQQ